MNWIEWTAIITAGSLVYVYVAFMALCTAVRMRAAAKARGFDLPWEMKLVCYALLIGGAPADVIYNWTVGNWRFKFWRFNTPWKITYSSRVQWHIDHPSRSTNYTAAVRWAILLNAGIDGHIKHVPSP